MAYQLSLNPIKRLRDCYLKQIKWRKYEIGKYFHAGKGVKLWAKNMITIGDYCYLGAGTKISCDADLGNYVFTANNVSLVGRYDHNYQEIGKPILLSSRISDKDYAWKGLYSKVIIEDDVWIGFGAIILSGVKIGKGSVIAAGSLVIKDIEPYCIYGGVPAKQIATRFQNETDLKQHILLFSKSYKND